MKIEERAKEYVESYPRLKNYEYTNDDISAIIKNAFLSGAEEQAEIDEHAHNNAIIAVDEIYSRKLKERKEQLINKACEWLQQLPSTWDIYEDSHYAVDRDSIIEEFRKAMEE